ncbi:hypothetical protein QR97_36245 [Streptomyces sp. PBH53]|uniref:hypothetical protein n=1 Tax=Streptomyces TaxID=1883 RepID=UPI000656708A|nr:hypothetical protein [Streptomyces sp. PBH53]AKN74464.1 hypothetical protein QR97_36245 [Streptomyces sp. PBH53]
MQGTGGQAELGRGPADIETLTRRIGEMAQRILDLRSELTERDEGLAAARAASRDLTAQVNR